jgi:GT2 family glycosyltransferase
VSRRCDSTSIFIVDDASEADCSRYLREFVEQTPNSKLIVNKRQRGFPYNCNEILDNSSEPYICLLNSDTVVSPSWDEMLLSALKADESIGFVGPSTSWAHTRQCLSGACAMRYELNADSVAGVAQTVFTHYAGQVEELPTLSGFCFMFRRSSFKRIGYFDERFGLGGVEEDDFILRGRRLGLRAMWIKYVYVHHYGQASFRAELGSQTAELWQRNQLIFEIKQLLPSIKELSHSRIDD